MVSDSELVGRLQEFLSTSDLNTTTTAIVRRKLEADFGVDLSDRKAFIREQIDLYLQTQQPKDEEEIEEQEQEEGIEEDSKDEHQEEELEEEEEGDEEEGEEEEDSNSKRGSKRKNKAVKKRGGGFTKLCSLSPKLQKFTGVPELARTEVVKRLWTYIRENNLQEPSNKRNILCDEILRDLFEVDSIDMFQMNKALTKHIWPLDADGPVTFTKKEKPKKLEREDDSDEPKRKEKKRKVGGGGAAAGGTTGIHAPIPLSDALVKFLGTGEIALPRSAVIKRIWDYIKQNNLQDPSDKRNIICDEKLKELFDVDTFTGFTVSKLLTAHFIKTERSLLKSSQN